MAIEKKEISIIPENLQQSEGPGFTVMKRCLLDLFGEAYTNRVTTHAKAEFAKKGHLGWKPRDDNTVVDVSPMPEPWGGQWGFRLRFCVITSAQDIEVAQYYVPASQVPGVKKGDFSRLN